MTASRALVSSVAMTTDESLRSDHLKLCYLWYDEILFETLRPDLEDHSIKRLVGDLPRRDLHEISDVFVGVNRRLPEEVTGTISNRLPRGYPRWGEDQEHYDYPDPENALEFAHNQLLRAIEAEMGVGRFDGIDVEHAEGSARVAVDAVALWDRVNRHLPCMLQSNAHEKLAVEAVATFQLTEPHASASVELFQATIPSLAKVSWSEIAQLRRQGGFKALRSKIEQASALAAQDFTAARQIFSEFEDDTVSLIVDKFRPKVRKVALEGILANVPGFPVFNPFSLFFSSRDTGMAIKNASELSWLYLLRDIRMAAAKVPPVET